MKRIGLKREIVLHWLSQLYFCFIVYDMLFTETVFKCFITVAIKNVHCSSEKIEQGSTAIVSVETPIGNAEVYDVEYILWMRVI